MRSRRWTSAATRCRSTGSISDTFQPANRALPLSVAPPALIAHLRDAISPLHRPRYEPAAGARWLRADDVVVGYADRDQAWAFPVRILNLHEIVNDELGGEPVLVSYCPLCGSGIVFSRRLGNRLLTFGNTSALYQSNMVMLDYETGSYWWQVAGRAIVGTLTGEQLRILPSTTATWGDWRRLHPGTRVLSRDTGFRRNYARDPFENYAITVNEGRFAFPVSGAALDQRLPSGARVLAIKLNDQVRGYLLDSKRPLAFLDTVGGQEIVVFVSRGGASSSAFRRRAGGRVLAFDPIGDEFVDRETRSVWDIAGRSTAGELAGQRLEPVPSRVSFWFAIVAAEPELELYVK